MNVTCLVMHWAVLVLIVCQMRHLAQNYSFSTPVVDHGIFLFQTKWLTTTWWVASLTGAGSDKSTKNHSEYLLLWNLWYIDGSISPYSIFLIILFLQCHLSPRPPHATPAGCCGRSWRPGMVQVKPIMRMVNWKSEFNWWKRTIFDLIFMGVLNIYSPPLQELY